MYSTAVRLLNISILKSSFSSAALFASQIKIFKDDQIDKAADNVILPDTQSYLFSKIFNLNVPCQEFGCYSCITRHSGRESVDLPQVTKKRDKASTIWRIWTPRRDNHAVFSRCARIGTSKQLG